MIINQRTNTTVAAAGKPPRRIAFPQRQKQRFVQPGRLSPPQPIHRSKPRVPPGQSPGGDGVDAVNVRKLLEEKLEKGQEGGDEARRQRHAVQEPSTSGRGGVRSKRVAIQQQQQQRGVGAPQKGFGGDGLPLPTNAKGWQVCVGGGVPITKHHRNGHHIITTTTTITSSPITNTGAS